MLDPVVPFTIPRLSGRFVARSSSCVSDATREDSRSNREIDYGFFFVDRWAEDVGRDVKKERIVAVEREIWKIVPIVNGA